jgi:ribose-phosphate pyrophosphokinase
MRQDEVFAPGQPISQRVVGRALADAFDRVLTLEAHLHRVRRLEDVAGVASRSLSAAPAIAAWLRRDGGDAVIVGPDEESSPWVRAIAEAAGVPWVLGRKRRHGDRRVGIELPEVPRGARAVIVDDIASSGGTIATAARALHRRGVSAVDAVVVHAIFAPGAVRAIRAAGVRRLVSCDTIPHRTNAIATADLFAAALNGTAPGRVPDKGGKR